MLFSLILLLAGSQSTPQQVLTDPDVVKATWASPPEFNFSELARSGIERAEVHLTCAVSVEGRAEDCQADQEEPAGSGIAEAALAGQSGLRLNPTTRDGIPVPDSITFKVGFENPNAGIGAGRGRQLSSAEQRVFNAIGELGFVSGTCSAYLIDQERERFEAGAAQYRSDMGTLPVLDQVLFAAYERGTSSAKPRPEYECRSELSSIRARVAEMDADLRQVESQFFIQNGHGD